MGVLYVVDSISRMYQEQARRHGQDISTTLDDATFAGGLRHITSVLPSLMNDIIQHAPDTQKVILKFYPNGELFRRNIHNFLVSHHVAPLLSGLYFSPLPSSLIFVDGNLSVNCRKR